MKTRLSTQKYGAAERHLIDVFPARSARRTPAQPAPILIYLYGGSWKSGSRKIYRFLGRSYAARGYCVAIPDYRLFPEAPFPGFVEDAAQAVAWVRAHASSFGGDPSRIVLMGHSAGAHIGALLALDEQWLGAAGEHPSNLNGFFGLAGPYTFNPLDFDSVRAVFEGTPDINLARPIKQVHAKTMPMVLAHGSADKTVGFHNSQNLAEALRGAGGQAELIRYHGLGHIAIMASIAWPLRFLAPVFRDSLDAFDRFLTAGAAAPRPIVQETTHLREAHP